MSKLDIEEIYDRNLAPTYTTTNKFNPKMKTYYAPTTMQPNPVTILKIHSSIMSNMWYKDGKRDDTIDTILLNDDVSE